MAGAEKRDDEDNILAHLLPLTNGAASPFEFVEEDEEEVNYSATDEDVQSEDLPGSSRRAASLAQQERSSAGADGAPSERGKHKPISWQRWQGPDEPARKDGATGRSGGGESVSERRRQQTSSDGAKGSSREGREPRASRRSPARSRGWESAREWRDRVLREGAAEMGAAPERPSSREGSRHRSERGPGQKSEDRKQTATAPISHSRDADEAAGTRRGRKRERNNPRIGPPGHHELKETSEQAELRRTKPAEADAGVHRQRSRTPLPPPAMDHVHSPRRARRSISPPPRRYAVPIDHAGPPRRAGSSPPWDGPSGQWRPGRGARSPPRDWPPPPHFFGGPPSIHDPPPSRHFAEPPPHPRYAHDWERDRRSRPLDPFPPPPHHLARDPYERRDSPIRERRVVAHAPGFHPREPPHASAPDSPSFRRRRSPPRRRESPSSIDPRLRGTPRRSSVELREAEAERRRRHSASSPAARRGSAERKVEDRVMASRSSRLQVSSRKEPAAALDPEKPSAGRADRAKDGSSKAAQAAQNGDRRSERASGASRSAKKEGHAEQAAGASVAASTQENGAEAQTGRKSPAQQSSQEPPVASEKDAAGKTLACQEQSSGSGMTGSTPAAKAADADTDKAITAEPAAADPEPAPSAAELDASGTAPKASTPTAPAMAQDEAAKQPSEQEPGTEQPGDAGQALPVSSKGMWGPYSATVGGSAIGGPSKADAAPPTRKKTADAASAAPDKGSRPSTAAVESAKERCRQGGKQKSVERGRKDSGRQTTPKASTATNGRGQNSRGAKRARDETRQSRRPALSNKRRVEVVPVPDRDSARRGSHSSAHGNGNGHVADRDVEPKGADLPPPPPLALSALDQSAGLGVPNPSVPDEHCMEWLYLDPKGKTQGPCSIADFKKWLGGMRVQPNLRKDYEEFLSCFVWRKDFDTSRTILKKLLG